MGETENNNGVSDFRAEIRIRASPEYKAGILAISPQQRSTAIIVNPSKHTGCYKYHLL
jgi:hypothetical protein